MPDPILIIAPNYSRAEYEARCRGYGNNWRPVIDLQSVIKHGRGRRDGRYIVVEWPIKDAHQVLAFLRQQDFKLLSI